ncbi:hypothetical protein PYCCODRAFT_1429443 [Trametes coccinea BRFM310]|uniref:Uncharacterized protein n=1 Tax=Trametes coccinea (strain BRFM310) TaxID=1353009 RepID=A0A1Y2J808_TRAC3|nr:hypothetical protein PYCCODRAFT_1429443 [Trametes coccinea BRFM310]
MAEDDNIYYEATPFPESLVTNEVFTERCREARRKRRAEYAEHLNPISPSKTESLLEIINAAQKAGGHITPTLHFGFFLTPAEMRASTARFPEDKTREALESLNDAGRQNGLVHAAIIVDVVNAALKQKGSRCLFFIERAVAEDHDAVIFSLYTTKEPVKTRIDLEKYKPAIDVFKTMVTTQREPLWHFADKHNPWRFGWKPFDAARVIGEAAAPLLALWKSA